MTLQNFTLDIDADGIALVTWNMPGRSISHRRQGRRGTFVDRRKVTTDAAIKGAVITSGKDTFCGGADLSMLERKSRLRRVEEIAGRGGGEARLFEDSRKLSLISGGSRPAASRGWRRSPAPRWAAASSSRSPAITGSPPTTTRRGSACRRSRSDYSPAAAAHSASRECCSRPTRCNSCSRATISASTAPRA